MGMISKYAILRGIMHNQNHIVVLYYENLRPEMRTFFIEGSKA